jgi:hypothetical protein
MNAREKTSELIVDFQLKCKTLDYQEAKQCALIEVDEILNAGPLDPNYVDWDDCGATHQYWYEAQKEEANEFWNNVKSELQSF